MINGGFVSLIIENLKGQVLLMLRDDKSTIPYPNCWAFIGGHIEEGETPEQALVREVKEELDYDLKKYDFFKKYACEEGNISVFYIKGDYKIEDFRLGEGQKIQFFSKKEIQKLKTAYTDKEMLMDYFKNAD